MVIAINARLGYVKIARRRTCTRRGKVIFVKSVYKKFLIASFKSSIVPSF
jgi:hypothetical protein